MMINRLLRVCACSFCLSLSACAAYIGGELKDVARDTYQQCGPAQTGYRVELETNAKNGYTGNPAFFLTEITLGILPTYWTNSVYSRATLYRHNELIDSYEFDSRIHVFYGLIWPLLLDVNGTNALTVDEGFGVHGRSGVLNRTIAKVAASNNLDASDVCYTN